MKNLPIGIQTFSKLREGNFYYVDKTEFVHRLATQSGGYYFLSRPRRFGKSLFLSTLKSAFMGKKELFKGLYLEHNWDWSKKHPVIHISFGAGVTKDADELRRSIFYILKNNQEDLGVKCHEINDFKPCLSELIKLAYQKYNKKVVILIDEYDKPILDQINKPEIAIEIRDELKNFYSVVKDSDEYLEFVFLTGVSKFSKVSLFSGLNNLEDITLDQHYSSICGYTQNELETVFKEKLKDVDLTKLKEWYNGYNFLGEGVYNPFAILLYALPG